MTTTADQSLWLTAIPAQSRPPLTGEHTFDVAVVGGGITGLTTALLLKRRGLDVIVLEADRVASGVSGNNTAKVTALQATVYSRIRRTHGLAAATDYATASQAAVAQVAELVRSENIDCDLRRAPAVTYAYTEDEVRDVDHELISARHVGLPVRSGATDVDLPFPVHAAIRLDDQIALHPVKYLQGLADAVDGDGSRVCEHSRVLDVTGTRLSTKDGSVNASQVVIATHYPTLDRGLYFARLQLTRAYCIAARVKNPTQALAISTGSPSWSVSAHGDKLILAGQSHATGKPVVEPFRRLEDFARQHWQVEEVTHRWSAQDPTSYDHLPMIGGYTPGSDTLFTATGYMKWGLTSGTFAGTLLADLVTGKPNDLADRFSPHRLSLKSLPDLVKKNAEVAAQMVGDRIAPADATSSEDLLCGQAHVIRDGLGKTGVYRDADGKLHGVSLRCTHLGCLVRFNAAEHSWDCPCHGSRFDVDGTVLEGPATRPLPKKEPR